MVSRFLRILQRAKLTPSTVHGLEDLEVDFAAELHDTVLTVIAAVAVFVALIDVPSGLEVEVPEAFPVMLSHRIRKHFSAILGGGIS